MSVAHDYNVENSLLPNSGSPVTMQGKTQVLHRIADARRRQNISVRSAARRLGKSPEQVRRLEDPTHDMLVSELYDWQRVLEVPIVDLLVDANAPLSEPVLARARLLKVMKTVRAIKETAKCVNIERMATMLEQQLVEIMPELRDVSAWHSVGQRRSHDELGRTAERVIPESVFNDHLG